MTDNAATQNVSGEVIPALDQHGLLPIGIHDCTLAEIGASYCWTNRRQEIFAGLCNFITQEWLPLNLGVPLYIDGSFVRNKPVPDDVDVVMELSSIQNHMQLSQGMALWLRNRELKAIYNVDVWPRHPMTGNDLAAFFQYIGEKAAAELKLPVRHPKGILRVHP